MTTITIKKNGKTSENTNLPTPPTNSKPPTKSLAKPHTSRQWENLIGKRYELILKPGHIVWADVTSIHAHTLTTSNARIQRRDAELIEICTGLVHIDCQNIAVAIEQERS